MSFTLVERALDGERATAFFLKRFEEKGNTLCRTLATIVARGGSYSTLAPSDLSDARIHEFDRGGLLPENLDPSHRMQLEDGSSIAPVFSVVEEWACLLVQQLRGEVGRIAIVDDYLHFSDIEKWGIGARDFACGDEAYHLLTAEMTEEAVADVLGYSGWLTGVVALCARAPSVVHNQAPAEEVVMCAETVFEVACTAYDNEGFVRWRRA